MNDHFGDADSLKALSSAVHDRGMYIMFDVIANHFSSPGAENTVDYGSFTPFNESWYYHPYCEVTNADYTDNQTAVEVVSKVTSTLHAANLTFDSAGLATRTTSLST